MYQALYASVPNVDAYLERIHRKRPEALTKEYLDDLIYAHQCHIPFENLDVWLLGKEIQLDIASIYDKVVNRKRGGYCFELNAIFTALLKDLGYHAYSCMCRIIKDEEELEVHLVLHRGIVVELEGKQYYCDVGYGGPMPPGAIEIRDGAVESAKGETYYISRANIPWWTLKRKNSSGEIEPMLQFYTMPQEAVDYIPLNDYCSKNSDSFFKQVLYLNKRMENGSVLVMGNHLTRVADGNVAEDREFDMEELNEILEKYFNIVL